MRLPTRNRAYCAFSYEDLPEEVGHVVDAYVSNVLQTEAEWRARDGRLQAIADAWARGTDQHERLRGQLRVVWPDLAVLLDFLTEEDNDE